MVESKILYHGSNTAIYIPKLNENKESNDFGNGFYLTPCRSQAKKWAKRKAYISGVPILNTYSFSGTQSDLKILKFSADIEWVNFVIDNRLGIKHDVDADIIFGPTADGRLFRIISSLRHGKISMNEALLAMKPERLSMQYCFKTEKSLSYLKFVRKENV